MEDSEESTHVDTGDERVKLVQIWFVLLLTKLYNHVNNKRSLLLLTIRNKSDTAHSLITCPGWDNLLH